MRKALYFELSFRHETHQNNATMSLYSALPVYSVVTRRRLPPPKNAVIALWPNTRVVKCKYYGSQKQNEYNNNIHYTIFYSLFYINSRLGFYGLKYVYSVISVIDNSLPSNTGK